MPADRPFVGYPCPRWLARRLTPGLILTLLAATLGCRDDSGKGGPFNFGGYCNPKVTELANQVLVESDTKKRDELIAQAFTIIHDDVSHIPLHQQVLVWGSSKKLDIVQRADNQVLFYWAKLKI